MFRTLLLFLFVTISATAQENKTPLLIRCDDIGMCHTVNMAAEKILQIGMPVSISVITPGPWFMEAAEMLKKYSNASVGIHLTLNSEWKQLRWGPVSGAGTVPSLVDGFGNFFGSRAALFGNNPQMSEIETELRAQIEKAKKAGLKIDYLDYHMGAAMQTAQTRAIVEKLAAEYHVAISRYYAEEDVDVGYSATPQSKLDTLIKHTMTIQPGNTRLFVFHIGLETDEMNALEDLNPTGPKEMSKHRHAEFDALSSVKFQQLIHGQRFRLVNYGMLNQEKGLASMKKPANQP